MFGSFANLGIPPFINAKPHHSHDHLSVDLAQTDTYFVCYCDLPGLTANEIIAELRGGGEAHATFTIRGEWPPATPLAAPRVLSRTLPVPPGVNCDAINTTYTNGVLRVVFPKWPPTPVSSTAAGAAAGTGTGTGRLLAITVGPRRAPGDDETKMDATSPQTPPRSLGSQLQGPPGP
jgi:HSP20 family molecular chaperone IbpA